METFERDSVGGWIARARVIGVKGNHDWCLFEDGRAADLFHDAELAT